MFGLGLGEVYKLAFKTVFEKEVAIDTVEHCCGRVRDRLHSLVYTASVSAAVVLPQMLAKVHSAFS